MKKRIFTLISFLIFFLSALDSNASHFRFGHISWTRTPGTRDVTFTVTTAWRYDYTDPVTLTFGDGTSSASSYGTEILYVPNEYRVFRAQFTHTYSSDGPFTVSFGSCCRISTLQNGADDSYIFSTVVCLANNNLGSPAYSPTSPVVIEMTAGTLNQIQLATSEPDGSTISYSTTAILGANYVPTIGGNVASVSSTGLVSWNTTGATAGQLYQMKVIMSDGCAKSEIDFIVKIVTSCIPTATISGSQIINQGANATLNLSFTGTSPWKYRLSGTNTDVTTSISPTTITVTPPSTTTYTLTSVSNSCGAGTTSGNAEVTVASPIDLITCQPLDGNVTDQVGYNNGSVISNGGSNSYVANRNGTPNTALSISNGSYVEFPVVSLLNNTFMHSVWVSPASLPASGSYAYILSIGGIGLSQDLYLENQGGVVKWVFTSSTTNGYIDVKSQGAITVGQWYHLAMVRTVNDLQLYVNGVLAQSVPATGLSSLYASSSVVRIGTKSSGLVFYFNGKVDDVRLYKGGMNSADITSLYNTTLNCPTITGSQVISLTNITDNTLCKNQLESVNFLQNGVAVGSTYSVQLSDASGNFTNPTTIGSGTSSPIQVSIPNTVTTSGSGYLIRIVNGTTTSFNTLPITIFPTVTGVITGTASIPEGQSTNLTINFTGTSPWNYSISNGQSSTSYTSSTPTVTQNVSPLTTTVYSLSSVSDNTCGTGTVSGSAVVSVSPALQLLACYPLNGDALDSKGFHSGVIYGATATTDRFGNPNSAFNFNGTSDYILLSNANDFKNNTFSYSAWVSPASTPALNTGASVLFAGSGQGMAYINRSVGGTVWGFTTYNDEGISYDINPSFPVSAVNNTWHHVVIVRSATQSKLYYDGNLVQTSTTSSPTTATYTHSNPSVIYRATIGTRPDATNIQFFNGKIDDVKIYKGVLNDAQVKAVYFAEVQCPIVETGGLITATSLSSNTSCPSGIISVNVITNNITASAGFPFIVELSNSSGQFTNPIQIGSGTTNSISCTLPSNIVAGNYKVRVVFGTSPNQVESVNSLPITINPAVTATISGTATINSGDITPLTINFTGGGPWTYRLSGTTTDVVTSVSPTIINVSPAITTSYSLLSVRNTCGVGTFSGSAVVTVNVIPQLLACYKFDGNALDSKGSNHGTVSGATLTTDRFGKANSAYSFNGISNYISIPGASLAPNQYTYAAWVNASNTTAYSQTIISIGGNGSDQAVALTNVTASNPNWNFFSYIYYAALPIPQVLSTNNVTTNQWHFVVATRTINNLTLYIDGKKVGTVSSTGVAPAYATPIAGAIGSRYRADIQFFTGKIDDVKIYVGALTEEEVSLLYNEEQGECSSPCSGMIYSLASGDWNTPATWSCGRVPNLSDKVLIKSGHNITISTNNANAKKLLNSGRVSFANTTSRLTFSTN
jgi:hypothetical protein